MTQPTVSKPEAYIISGQSTKRRTTPGVPIIDHAARPCVCLSSVGLCNVRASYSVGWNFR